MQMCFNAYRVRNPLYFLLQQLGDTSHADVVDFISRIRWNLCECSDLKHPLHVIVDHIKRARNQTRDPDATRQAQVDLAYFATCMPQIWCRSTPGAEIRMHPDYELCAYSEPNIAVPYLWFHADEHLSLTLIKSHVFGPLKHKTLAVATYRMQTMGMMNPLPSLYRFDGNMEADQDNLLMLHILVRQDVRKNISANLFKAMTDCTFMVFFSEGRHMRFVSATLNDSKRRQIYVYPVAFHPLEKP